MITSQNYDYLLGGKDTYAADRAAVDAVLKVAPMLGFSARANRAFLGRVIRYLAEEAGVRQFLDIGTGIPTAGNTHQVAQAVAPESRLAYVDYDAIVLAHARALLASNLPPGSHLAISHLGAELLDDEAKQGFENIVRRQAQQQYIGRSYEQMTRFYAGMDLVDPGLVRVEEWRPGPSADPADRSALWCALGRKR